MKKRIFILQVILSLLIIMIKPAHSQNTRGFTPIKVTQANANGNLYKYSYALIIGESNYTNGWQRLNGVKTDVQAVKTVLEQHGFYVVVKENLTSNNFDKEIKSFIATYGQEVNSRVLIYYAGHGHTIKNKLTGEAMGYVVPVDAPNPAYDMGGFLTRAVDMNQFNNYAKQIQAKHVLFMFDACFAGTIFSGRAGVPPAIDYKTSEPVRQFITSGDESEVVADNSIFRREFVNALTSNIADADKDGFLTASELALYLYQQVANNSNGTQHPVSGKLKDANYNKGDFVFVLNTNNGNTTPNRPVIVDDGTPVNNGNTDNTGNNTTPQLQTGSLTIITDYSGTLTITDVYGKQLASKRITGGYKYTINNLPAGAVVLNITSASGKKLWNAKVMIRSGQTTTIRAEKTTGTLQLITDRTGSFYIDGSYKRKVYAGNTYTFNEIPAGNHTIKISGTTTWQETVNITAKQTTTVRAEKPAGTLQLTTQTRGNFYIDGILQEYVTNGNYTYNDLTPGNHTAKIVSGGQTLWQSSFTITANQTKYLTAKAQNTNPQGGNYTETYAGVNMDFVFVKGGTFKMGSNDGYSDEQPVHSVTVSDFYIGKYEVTVEQYIKFLNDIGCSSDGSYNGEELVYIDDSYCPVGYSGGRFYFKGSDYADKSNCPMIEVTWYGANEYAKWLSRKTGKQYRLPTEAEWEYAARGGVETHGRASQYKYAGSNNIDEVAWYGDNSGGKTHPVGTKKPNELGIYDMSGNVWEWVEDKYHNDYKGAPTDGSAWISGNSSYRVFRGGSWGNYAYSCRVADRSDYAPTGSVSYVGFRLALQP